MLNQTSLARKIIAAIAIPSALVAVIVVTLVTIIVWDSSKESLLSATETRAKIIAANSTPSLAFRNVDDANEILSSLVSDPNVSSAVLYDNDGVEFASYRPFGAPADAPPPASRRALREGSVFEGRTLFVYQPVRQKELRLGTLALTFDLQPLYSRLRSFLLAGVGIGLLACGCAVGLAIYLQGPISRPILELAGVADSVRQSQSYDIRAPENEKQYAEVHMLTRSFNEMLERIQSQDTSLRESEMQFRRAIANAPIPIAIFEQSGRILELSKGWTDSTALTLDESPNLIDWLHARCPAPVAETLSCALTLPQSSGETIELGEIEVRNQKEGDRIWHANLTTLGSFRHTKKVWLLLAVDLTERVQALKALEQRTQDLERSNQELDDFAYIASHDMKEPLRGIHNNAMFLDEDYGDKLDQDGKKRIDRMQFLCKRLETLIDDLLYYSRIGRHELAIQRADPNKMVHDIERMMETNLEIKNAKIVVANTLPHCVCDAVRVQEVFRNLISNAIKYNTSEEKRVEVGYLDQKDGHRHVYYVRDNGIGIDPKFYHEVFRIFKRLNTESEEEKGTGSGLTFVKKIVERHEGSVWLESEPNVGSTFYFTLGPQSHIPTPPRS